MSRRCSGRRPRSGTFDPNTWYYIGARTEKTAFFRPDTVERKVVVVKFDEAGTVADVHELDQNAGKEVELVERTTPTAGRDMNFIEQMLGNVGRFSGGNAASASRACRGGKPESLGPGPIQLPTAQ